jgi:hypothetical protein
MAAIEAAKGGEGPLGPFLNDPTLRAGDVVVTTKGFMMFRGEESQSHRQTDFVSIAHASGLAANKKTLISLERASHLWCGSKANAQSGPRSRKLGIRQAATCRSLNLNCRNAEPLLMCVRSGPPLTQHE